MTEQILDLRADPTRESRALRGLPGGRREPWRDRFARERILGRLGAIRRGALTVVEGGAAARFGEARAELTGTVVVDDPAVYRRLLLRGALGGAEAYVDGLWRSDDPTAVLRVLAANREAFDGLEASLPPWVRPSLALFHRLRSNTRAGSRRNIAAHYDLGNEFFALFLDPTLTYSCGIFASPETSMEEASRAKYDRIARRLGLRPGQRVLEIGTGWGGFAVHAARHYGCHVTTTTISRRQHEYAEERVRREGLEGRIEVRCDDYRDLRGRFDRIVSIEMIEAVGNDHLERFFRVCGERLADDGALMLQAITVPDADLPAHRRSVDFIKRYVFPGGELVSVGALVQAASRAAGLRTVDVVDLSAHYAETLRRWRARMQENRERMRGLGLDERFLRLWEYYLCYCEAGFEERRTGVVQALFARPGCRGLPSPRSALLPAS